MNQPQFPNESVKILAISGSLRAASSNTNLLRAAQSLAPEGVEITLYNGLSELPHFNPDLDGEIAPASVADFRAQLQACDAVMICSPEYAHGVPGVLKNALDWIVGSGEFMEKPVALINARPASMFAQTQIAETLGVMMAVIVPEASVAINLGSNKIDVAGILADAEIGNALRSSISSLARAVKTER